MYTMYLILCMYVCDVCMHVMYVSYGCYVCILCTHVFLCMQVALVKKETVPRAITLSIGDGANDVSMILEVT